MRALSIYFCIAFSLFFPAITSAIDKKIVSENQEVKIFESALVQDTTPQMSCVFSWLEAKYPQYYAPASTGLLTYNGNSYRYYAKTDSLLVYNPTYDHVYSGYNYYGYYYYIDLGAFSDWKSGTGCSRTVTPDPTCTAPQVLQNNVCVTPTPTCAAPQVLKNNVCVIPPSTISSNAKILFCDCGDTRSGLYNPNGGLSEDALLQPYSDWKKSSNQNITTIKEMLSQGWSLEQVISINKDQFYIEFIK